MTKKQRRSVRKKHLEKLKKLRETYLNASVETRPDIKVVLGKATGVNPFGYKLSKGSTPKPAIAVPNWRPDQSLPPDE